MVIRLAMPVVLHTGISQIIDAESARPAGIRDFADHNLRVAIDSTVLPWGLMFRRCYT
jgi:hypothetical protein